MEDFDLDGGSTGFHVTCQEPWLGHGRALTINGFKDFGAKFECPKRDLATHPSARSPYHDLRPGRLIRASILEAYKGSPSVVCILLGSTLLNPEPAAGSWFCSRAMLGILHLQHFNCRVV